MDGNTGECVTLEQTEQIKKNLSGMDKKTTKEKETKEENKVTNVSLAAGQVLW